MHVGAGKWIIINSCRLKRAEHSVPLQYLQDLGVDPASVEAIVASHWDDDHIGGFSELVRRCTRADVILSQAFGQKDFLAYARAFDLPSLQRARAGAREIYRTVKDCRAGGRALTYAAPCRRVIHKSSSDTAHRQCVDLWTLSPSDFEYENFLAWVAQTLPSIPQTRRLSVSRKRNDLSTVVW